MMPTVLAWLEWHVDPQGGDIPEHVPMVPLLYRDYAGVNLFGGSESMSPRLMLRSCNVVHRFAVHPDLDCISYTSNLKQVLGPCLFGACDWASSYVPMG
jgi:hypothetical protein